MTLRNIFESFRNVFEIMLYEHDDEYIGILPINGRVINQYLDRKVKLPLDISSERGKCLIVVLEKEETKEPNIHRISKGDLPPIAKHVLIYCGNRNWKDNEDPQGALWKVAKRRPYVDGHGNGSYCFREFGSVGYHGTYDADEIDIWCELPVLNESED